MTWTEILLCAGIAYCCIAAWYYWMLAEKERENAAKNNEQTQWLKEHYPHIEVGMLINYLQEKRIERK